MSFKEIRKAIKENKLKDVKKLVERYPVIVNIENSDGSTPLFMAVHEEHLEIVKYLIVKYSKIANNGKNATVASWIL